MTEDQPMIWSSDLRSSIRFTPSDLRSARLSIFSSPFAPWIMTCGMFDELSVIVSICSLASIYKGKMGTFVSISDLSEASQLIVLSFHLKVSGVNGVSWIRWSLNVITNLFVQKLEKKHLKLWSLWQLHWSSCLGPIFQVNTKKTTKIIKKKICKGKQKNHKITSK